jgi:hypothetical protein
MVKRARFQVKAGNFIEKNPGYSSPQKIALLFLLFGLNLYVPSWKIPQLEY